MKHVEYKSYQGAVSYEDGRLVVQILHITDFVVAECDSASAVGTVFRELVDEYITDCKALGREPNKPFKGTFNVRVSPDLHREAVLSATRHEQTLNAWVSNAISGKLSNERDIVDKQAIKTMFERFQILDQMAEQSVSQVLLISEVGKLPHGEKSGRP
ncbi:MAG: type II toxin-antitoxin system HicB family antitoxin, partial [Rhodospirillales bacterium]